MLLYDLVGQASDVPKLPDWQGSYCLGATSNVYMLSDKARVLKLSNGKKGSAIPFATETEMLARLNRLSISGVPLLVGVSTVESSSPSKPTGARGLSASAPVVSAHGNKVDFLVMSPVCDRFGPKGESFRGQHAHQLGAILLAAGADGIVHRDVRPANVMHKDGRVYLMDWGYAVNAGKTLPLQGTLRCASPRCLQAVSAGGRHMWSPVDDWHSWLRACILLAYPDVQQSLGELVGPENGVAT